MHFEIKHYWRTIVKFRVLLVEDDRTIQKIIKRKFSAIEEALKKQIPGFEFEIIDTLNGGDEIVVIYANAKPHVVLMDYSMAGGNGDEGTLRIRKHYPDANIILHSTNTKSFIERAIEKFKEADEWKAVDTKELDGSLPKPCSIREICIVFEKYWRQENLTVDLDRLIVDAEFAYNPGSTPTSPESLPGRKGFKPQFKKQKDVKDSASRRLPSSPVLVGLSPPQNACQVGGLNLAAITNMLSLPGMTDSAVDAANSSLLSVPITVRRQTVMIETGLKILVGMGEVPITPVPVIPPIKPLPGTPIGSVTSHPPHLSVELKEAPSPQKVVPRGHLFAVALAAQREERQQRGRGGSLFAPVFPNPIGLHSGKVEPWKVNTRASLLVQAPIAKDEKVKGSPSYSSAPNPPVVEELPMGSTPTVVRTADSTPQTLPFFAQIRKQSIEKKKVIEKTAVAPVVGDTASKKSFCACGKAQ